MYTSTLLELSRTCLNIMLLSKKRYGGFILPVWKLLKETLFQPIDSQAHYNTPKMSISE